MIRTNARLRAFTIVEMFAVLILISGLVVLLLPAVQSAREMARRTSCANNLMQVALSVQAYHSAFEQLPTQLSGTDGSTVRGADNDRRLSIFVGLLPFLGSPELSDTISNPLDRGSPSEADPYGMEAMWMDDGASESMAEAAEKKDESPWVAGGPEVDTSNYRPWISEVAVMRCPSDPGAGIPAFGRNNYAACLGDGLLAADSGPMKEVGGTFVVDADLAAQTEAAMRGMFVPRVVMRMGGTTDGLSNTIMLGEIATALGDEDIRTRPVAGPGGRALRDNPLWARDNDLIDLDRPIFWLPPLPGAKLTASTSSRRGYRWADGMPLYTSVNTILPPNREIVMRGDRDDCWGILPPSSRHQGGAQVAFGDGAVRFVSDSIDAGDARQPTVYPDSPNPAGSESPFGLWGALGTRASGELKACTFGSKDPLE